MKNYIKSISKEKGVELNEEKLIEITYNALDVKFADRIHNLSTQWDPNDLDQVKKKVEETEKYFLEISKETNKVAYDKLQSLILVLKIRLNEVSSKVNSLVK
jgi:hypothetical protein